MTIEELQNQVMNLQTELTKVKTDYQALTTQKADVDSKLNTLKTESDKRISELQEHNQKLFLRVTHQKEDKAKTGVFKSSLLGDYAKALSEDELEILEQLERGL